MPRTSTWTTHSSRHVPVTRLPTSRPTHPLPSANCRVPTRQLSMGGTRYLGRHLMRMLRAASFERVELEGARCRGAGISGVAPGACLLRHESSCAEKPMDLSGVWRGGDTVLWRRGEVMRCCGGAHWYGAGLALCSRRRGDGLPALHDGALREASRVPPLVPSETLSQVLHQLNAALVSGILVSSDECAGGAQAFKLPYLNCNRFKVVSVHVDD